MKKAIKKYKWTLRKLHALALKLEREIKHLVKQRNKLQYRLNVLDDKLLKINGHPRKTARRKKA